MTLRLNKSRGRYQPERYLNIFNQSESFHFPWLTSPTLSALVSQYILWKDTVNQWHARYLLAIIHHSSYSLCRIVTTQSVSPQEKWSDSVIFYWKHWLLCRDGVSLVPLINSVACAFYLKRGYWFGFLLIIC